MEERRPRQPRPAGSQPTPSARPNPNRRRRTRKPPVRALAICAGLIFLAGFLLGFLVRGFFLPEAEQQPSEPQGENAGTPAESTGAAQTPAPQPAPADWRLVLVSAEHPLAESYSVELTKLSGGMEVDKRCYSDLQNLLTACKEAGFSPTIVSAYVSREAQQAIYDEAQDAAAALPGQSEHQTGLAVDIVDAMNQNLDESQRSSAIGTWLAEHSWRYGFIQRYPESAAAETGVAFEPWHYRYVGIDAAKAIHDGGLTLEGYLAALAG